MILIDEIIETDVKLKLESVSVANGFINDITVLPGYLVHYANDLLKGVNGRSFPAVAFQPVEDDPGMDAAKTKSKNSHIMKLIGAISVTDPSLVNQNLNSLLYDVRRVLAMNKYENESRALEFEVGKAVFQLPDSQDQYAFFEMPITIKYLEVWK